MSENDERVREAWAVLRRFNQVPLPQDEEGIFYNPRVILQAQRQGVRVHLSPARGIDQQIWFNSEEVAQEFLDSILMHWSAIK